MLTGLTTPGTKTSEFLIVVLNGIAQLVLALTNVLPAKYATLLGVAGALAYQVSRGLAKYEGRGAVPVVPVPPQVPPAA